MKSPQKCRCGCGASTKGGEFMPGHDGRYRTALMSKVVDPNLDASIREAVASEMERRGWGKYVARAQARAEEAARKQQIKDSKARAKQTGGGSKSSGLSNINGMKAAAVSLRSLGRYYRSDPGYIEITPNNWETILNGTHPALQGPHV